MFVLLLCVSLRLVRLVRLVSCACSTSLCCVIPTCHPKTSIVSEPGQWSGTQSQIERCPRTTGVVGTSNQMLEVICEMRCVSFGRGRGERSWLRGSNLRWDRLMAMHNHAEFLPRFSFVFLRTRRLNQQCRDHYRSSQCETPGPIIFWSVWQKVVPDIPTNIDQSAGCQR